MATIKPEAGPEAVENIIDLRKIGRRFGSAPAFDALVDVDFQIQPGEWVAITGPSGSGKSTLLNILGCLDRPTSGKYIFNGVDTVSLSDRERAGVRSWGIGFVFQSFHLLPHRSVLENVMLAEVYRKGPLRGRKELALAALERVGLSHRTDYLPTRLSGGERQRVAIARALVGSPQLLLCDEPTGNLDSRSSNEVLDLFERLNQQGITLVIVTHNDDVANRASRRVHIVDGALTDLTTRVSEKADASSINSLENPKPVWRSGMQLQDLLGEAVAGLFSRPWRTGLSLLGIVIGITALVATLGLSATASNRVISEFDEIASTEIAITAKSTLAGVDPKVIPWDAPTRLRRLNGVVAAGTQSEIDVGNALISSSPIKDPKRQTSLKLAVQAVSPGLFDAVRAELKTGRFLDLGDSQRRDRVAVLGPNAARRLGITSVDHLPAISMGDDLYLVIGILKNVSRQPNLLSSVIIPEGTARREFGLAGPGAVIIETRVGATSLIVQQARLALRPDKPTLLKVESPPEPQRVKDAVQSDLNVMLLLLGGLSLIVGAIGIANIMLVSVMERTGEIGLRRALGATRGHVAFQFLLESASMGIIGGILGASLGLGIVVAVSIYQTWTPVLDPVVPLAAPLVGGAIGLVSGTYPALRAAMLEPVEAFQH